MNLHLIILTLICVISLLLGLLVYFQDTQNHTNKGFVFLTFSIVIWVVTNFLCDSPYGTANALFWNKAAVAAGILIGIALFYFSLHFPKDYNSLSIFLRRAAIVIYGVFIFLTLFTNLIVKNVEILDWGTNIVFGDFFYIFVAWATFLIVLAIVILLFQYKQAVGVEKTRMKYFFVGLILFMFFAFSLNVILPSITGQNELAKYGPYSMILLIGLTAYAILKHQLFNIKVILTETAVVLFSMAILTQTLSSKTIGQGVLNGIILILVIYGGYLIIKSVIREIQFRQEMQQMAEQLAHANAHLKELDRMKTEFVSLASHELLTPVSAIEGYLSMLLDEKLARVDDPKAIKYMTKVYGSAKRLARLVTDMLNVSRIEEGRLLVEKQDVDLSDLIRQTIDELKFKADERKQRIVFQMQNANLKSQNENEKMQNEPEKFMTFGDPDKLKEVLVNLIGNSIKYSKEPGEISVSLETVPTSAVQETWQKIEEEIKAGPLDDQEAIKSAVDERLKRLVGEKQILVHIQDQGIGIPKEELPRLFKKFHRVGDYTTAESQGTGLGLYISRALVELNHGRIWANSEGPSHGSTFTFSLPEISQKQAILDLEAQVPKQKEALKPLAQPPKEAEEM